MVTKCKFVLLAAGFCFCLSVFPGLSADTLRLEGAWRVELDRKDEGTSQQWYQKSLGGKVVLPGTIQSQGLGDEVTVDTAWTGGIVDRSWFTEPQYEPYRQPGNVKVPFWLTPDKHFVGPAWFQREVDIPKAWQGKRIVLSLERPHWATTVWVDEQKATSCDSLSVAHEHDLTDLLRPGKHRLTIRVDNRLAVEVGINSHSVSDHTQGNWNGVVGQLFLRAGEPVWLENVQVYPVLNERKFKVVAEVGNRTGKVGDGVIQATAQSYNSAKTQKPNPVEVSVRWTAEGGKAEFTYDLGAGAQSWDEFNPALYKFEFTLQSSRTVTSRAVKLDSRTVVTGLREVKRADNRITLNGRTIFLRGTLECAIFPALGYPPTDVESWKRIVKICQAHGLNHIRFHSWCPPEAAFLAADELGFYYYVECPSWANQGSTVGDGGPLDMWLYAEGERMLRTYGNHPSFIMMAYGNEPAGKQHKRWLGDFVKYFKERDPRRLYTSGAGWPMIPENEFHVTPTPRVQAWGEGLKSRINAKPPETMTDYRSFIEKAGAPVISHEIGQWCVYPNFDEIKKYKGPLKAKNFEIFRDSLKARGMLGQARQFLLASGKLQTLCYKEDIESALRTPDMAGFELLDLHDFPGQGTALVGVLDPFWDEKGYVTPAEYHRFSCQTVPLARLKKRIYKNTESLQAQVEVAHFGPADIKASVLSWRLRDVAGKTVASGQLPAQVLITGTLTPVGEITTTLSGIAQAAKLNLEISVAGTPFANDWDVWCYPDKVSPEAPANVLVTEWLDEPALAALKNGGKVLLLVPPERVKGDALGRVQIGFSSIFWNTAWTKRQAPHTLGILCDPKHPALEQFPTEFHSNWQWWELVSRSHPFIMNDLPASVPTLVQVIDDWVTNRRLGLVFEAEVAGGKLLACGMDLAKDLEQRPVALQMRRSLLDYMAGTKFQPKAQLEVAQVMALLQESASTQK